MTESTSEVDTIKEYTARKCKDKKKDAGMLGS